MRRVPTDWRGSSCPRQSSPRAPHTAPAEECTAPLAGHKGPFVPDPSLHRCSVISGTTVTDCIPAALPGHLRAGAPGPRLRLPRDKGAGQGLRHLPLNLPPCPFPRTEPPRWGQKPVGSSTLPSRVLGIKQPPGDPSPRPPTLWLPLIPDAEAEHSWGCPCSEGPQGWTVWLQPLDKSWQEPSQGSGSRVSPDSTVGAPLLSAAPSSVYPALCPAHGIHLNLSTHLPRGLWRDAGAL